MTASSTSKDLGTLPIGKPYNFTFELIASSHPSHIDSISAGCSSCTTVQADKINVKPGETVILNVTFTPNALGYQTKFIHINYTEDGQTFKTTLKFVSIVENNS